MKGTFFIILYLMFFLTSDIQSQVGVNLNAPYNTPQNLVQNVLLGPGVVVVGPPTFNGDPLQIGFFNGGLSSIGIDSGVVISTDEINMLDVNYTGFGQTQFSMNPNTDLFNVANSVPPLIGQNFSINSVADVAELEFDFIPASDTVKFTFVFASNEYLNWVNSGFNDVFAFFISGPAITGPYSSPPAFPGGAQNIAIVPGSNPALPITISSVNNVLNSQFYIDNPFPNQGVAANGYTTRLQAISPVICGQVHHIRISIADAGDQSLMSAVFLEGGSFSSGNLLVSAQPSYNTSNGDSTLYEGCGDVKLTLSRRGDLTLQDTVYFELLGNATNGVDYTTIADTSFFAPGQDSIFVTFTPFLDMLTEGPETLRIKVYGDTNVCGFLPQYVTLIIYDPIDLSTYAIHYDTLACFNPSVSLTDSVLTGLGPFTFTWSTGFTETPSDSSSTISESPLNSSMYLVEIKDACGIDSLVDTFWVHVPPPAFSMMAPNQSVLCSGDSVFLNPTAIGGLLPYQFWWTTSAAQGLGTNLTIDSTRTLTLFMTDACAKDTISINIVITVPIYPPLILNSLSNLSPYCPGSPISMLATANGGSGSYVFTWDNWVTQSAQLLAAPLVTTSFTVQVSDFCRVDTISQTVLVTVPVYPPLTILYNDTNLGCYGDTINESFTVSGGTGIYTYYVNTNPITTPSFSHVLLLDNSIGIRVEDECFTDTNVFIHNFIKEPSALFEAVYFDVFDVLFYNRSEEDIVSNQWFFGDGQNSTDSMPTHSYSSSGEYAVTLVVTNDVGCIDSLTQIVKSPDIIWFPDAFTPNGDDLNEVWYPVHNGFKSDAYELTIFSRWGAPVFKTNNPLQGWDGKLKNGDNAEFGVYSFEVEGKMFYRNTDIKKTGRIVLIR